MSLRVGFAGTPEFAAVALQAIHDAGHSVPLVLTQPDRPAGRGLKLTPSPVKLLGLTLGASIAQPRSLRLDGKYLDDAAAAAATLASAELDVLVVAAYGLLLPRWVLDLHRLGCINIHASLLPRWRGAAPIHRAIEAGDALTGITIMQMDEGLDTGAMLLSESMAIVPEDTTALLHDRLATLGGRLICEALGRAERAEGIALPQPSEGISYANKIVKTEAAIDWHLPAEQIERRVRAFDPFPGAQFEWQGETVKVWRAAVVPGAGLAPGTVEAVSPESFTVACGQDALKVIMLQRPGGKRQPAAALLRAFPDLLDARLASSLPRKDR